MNRTIFSFLLFLGLIFIALYFAGDLFQSESATLNDQAEDPDIYLENVKKYAGSHEFDRSLHHLTRAIETIRVIEEDADIYSGKILEGTIADLLNIKDELETNTLSNDDMNAAIANALNGLALVELRVSETYAETNKLDKAKIAMNYGLFHLKNSLHYSKGPLKVKEIQIYNEIDSLLTSESLDPIDVASKISELVSALDSLLKEKEY